MNGAHWHLLFNHLPVAGSVFSFILLTSGFLIRNQQLKNSALFLFVLTGIVAAFAMLTGESAEHVLKAIGQLPESLAETHEELAEAGMWVIEISAAIALVALVANIRNWGIGKGLTLLTLVASFACILFFGKINNSGGEIRHSEIRSGTVIPAGEEGTNDKD